MNVERLHEIVAHLRTDLDKTGTLRILQKLVESLTNQVNSPQQAQYQNDTANNMTQLIAALEKSEVNDFSPAWHQVLVEIGAAEVTGIALANTVREIFASNQITPSVARDELQKLLNQLNQVSKAADQLLAGFNALRIGTEGLAPGECDVGVLVPRGFVDNRLDRFADELDELNTIFGTFAELVTGSRPGFEIKTISSSDLSVYIEVAAKVGACIAKAIAGVISLYKQLLEIRKLRSSLEEQGIAKQNLSGIDTHADTLMDSGINNIVTNMLQEFRSGHDSRDHELHIQLKYSLKKIAGRIDRGFNIEVRMEEPEVTSENGEDATTEDRELIDAHATVAEASKNMQFLKLEGSPILQLEDLNEAPPSQSS